jgi:hypothetical protein
MELIELNLTFENPYGMRHGHFLASRHSNLLCDQKNPKSMVHTPIDRELKSYKLIVYNTLWFHSYKKNGRNLCHHQFWQVLWESVCACQAKTGMSHVHELYLGCNVIDLGATFYAIWVASVQEQLVEKWFGTPLKSAVLNWVLIIYVSHSEGLHGA